MCVCVCAYRRIIIIRVYFFFFFFSPRYYLFRTGFAYVRAIDAAAAGGALPRGFFRGFRPYHKTYECIRTHIYDRL